MSLILNIKFELTGRFNDCTCVTSQTPKKLSRSDKNNVHFLPIALTATYMLCAKEH